ncbi:MAG: NAD(P)/FAD-dependent oxidoreductase [Clostridia bacterium]|nr:NAD(P)/FAD-dependent oxidoreductase [Clostridia bacterium]
MDSLQIAVIGGGAAGMMAAGKAASLGASVTLFEKNDRFGKKLYITGKGRCNVTNACSVNDFLANVPTNPRFLYGAAARFTPADTMEFFENLGVPLKVERGNRVFPVSDHSSDIVNALVRYMKESGVATRNEKVTAIRPDEDGYIVETSRGSYPFHRVIVATGGLSYPTTGSDGDGYRFAKEFGIDVTATRPSLVPLETNEVWCPLLQGLALKNVALTAVDTRSGKVVYRDFGEMLFTHFGLSGPVVLSLSAHLSDPAPGRYRLEIDLKPALDEATLDKRLLSDFAKYANKDFANALSDLLPSKMISVFVGLCGIPPHQKVHSVTKTQREQILHLLKHLTVTVKRPRPIAEAIITSGGISVKELSPKTMESKKHPGLYFVGEVIDLDAYTGGFNLQIAFSTAMAAASAAALEE